MSPTENEPRRSLIWQAVFAVILIVVVVTAGVLTIANSTRAATAAENSQEILDAINRQTRAILCVLLIEPTDRTVANIESCNP